MSDLRDAARQALAEEALQRLTDVHQEIEAALEQPEQEPLFVVEGGELRPLRPALLNEGDKLYTHPPRRREWRGLTEEETAQVLGFGDYTARSTEVTLTVIARAVEAALRSKNHG